MRLATPLRTTNSYYYHCICAAISVSDRTATTTADYTPGSTAITFAVGVTSAMSGAFTIARDTLVEDTEDFTVSIASLDGDTANRGVVIQPNPSTVFIFDRTCKYTVKQNDWLFLTAHNWQN